MRSGRHFAGYDTEPDYVEAARKRVVEASPVAGVVLPAEGSAPEGRAARDVAHDLLSAAGFTSVRPGGDVTFRAVDDTGHLWLVEVVGAFSSARPGLRRLENVWKTAGKAAAAGEPVLALTTDLPAPGTPADTALRNVCGPGKPLAGAVVLYLENTECSPSTALQDLRALLGATRGGSPGILG